MRGQVSQQTGWSSLKYNHHFTGKRERVLFLTPLTWFAHNQSTTQHTGPVNDLIQLVYNPVRDNSHFFEMDHLGLSRFLVIGLDPDGSVLMPNPLIGCTNTNKSVLKF